MAGEGRVMVTAALLCMGLAVALFASCLVPHADHKKWAMRVCITALVAWVCIVLATVFGGIALVQWLR
jgi:hypothetical protein